MTRPMDDPQVLKWWVDFLHVTRGGNPIGMTFAEYIAARLNMLELTIASSGSTTPWPWHPTDTVVRAGEVVR